MSKLRRGDSDLNVRFGNRRNKLSLPAVPASLETSSLQQEQLCSSLNCEEIRHLIMVHQQHGTALYALYTEADLQAYTPRTYHADSIITTLRGVALAILTADCVPLVLYHHLTSALAVVHVGWRGAVAGIVALTVKRLHHDTGSDPAQISAMMGPCAQVCCYQVSDEFSQHLSEAARAYGMVQKNGRWYFNLIAYITQELLQAGLMPGNINVQESACTICSDNYHSHRRDMHQAERNVTVAWMAKKLSK